MSEWNAEKPEESSEANSCGEQVEAKREKSGESERIERTERLII